MASAEACEQPGITAALVMSCAQRQALPSSDTSAIRGSLWLSSVDVRAKCVALGKALQMGLSLLHLYLAQMKSHIFFPQWQEPNNSKKKKKKAKESLLLFSSLGYVVFDFGTTCLWQLTFLYLAQGMSTNVCCIKLYWRKFRGKRFEFWFSDFFKCSYILFFYS